MDTYQGIIILSLFHISIWDIFSFGLTGIWAGLVVGRTLANILNYLHANHTLNHLSLEQADIIP